MKERHIKRYANRKMYDVEQSRYVSLSDLAEMIKAGESIRVTDKKGEKDYTAQILRQIVLEQGKQTQDASVSTLHDWVRMGGEFVDRHWDEWTNNLEDWVKEKSNLVMKAVSMEDYKALKRKVEDLEKKIEDLEKSMS